jgi:hypothetical protein
MNVFIGMRFAAWDDELSSADIAASIADLIGSGMSGNNGA